MMNLRDVMSPELQKYLKMYRKGALSALRGLRHGVVSNQKAAEILMDIFNTIEWKIDSCGYGVAHPCYIFASRILRSAKLLMGKSGLGVINTH